MAAPLSGIGRARTPTFWVLTVCCVIYFAFCWGIFTVTVEPQYGSMRPPSIEADSSNYFGLAGLGDEGSVNQGSLVNFGGSSLGPVITALIFRNRFGVAWFNCALFLLVIWWAGRIPGVRREVFAVLMMIEPQLLPTLMTLNKEIFAIAGLMSFAAYLYPVTKTRSGRASKWFLLATFVLSMFARWEQVLVIGWYLIAESKRSPIRNKPAKGIVALLLVCSFAWAAAVHIVHVNLAGFIEQAQGGVISRLYAIQADGGFFLVALPKILMNIAGRWTSPLYFLGDYWDTDFDGVWQNAYIGILSSLVMLVVVAITIVRDRFRLARPLIYFTATYFVCTALNPFIQHRYIYPAYALIALELARRSELLEPVPANVLQRLPALPSKYRWLIARGIQRYQASPGAPAIKR